MATESIYGNLRVARSLLYLKFFSHFFQSPIFHRSYLKGMFTCQILNADLKIGWKSINHIFGFKIILEKQISKITFKLLNYGN